MLKITGSNLKGIEFMTMHDAKRSILFRELLRKRPYAMEGDVKRGEKKKKKKDSERLDPFMSECSG